MKNKIDRTDLKIIMRLQENGRTTLAQLAKENNMTIMGVKKRLRKLIDGDIIKISALINPTKLDLILTAVYLEVENNTARKNILNKFKNCPRIIKIFEMVGGFNLLILKFAENKETLESECSQDCALQSQPGIRRSETHLISNVQYTPYFNLILKNIGKKQEITPCGVNCQECVKYEENKCLGCPSTKYYRREVI
ncbi:MAG: winged helix-turn-helix transcriptional regulator [Candidatus Odinarchaeia archaeon]